MSEEVRTPFSRNMVSHALGNVGGVFPVQQQSRGKHQNEQAEYIWSPSEKSMGACDEYAMIMHEAGRPYPLS